MTDRVLASWADGPTRKAVLDFVEGATTSGPDFVDPADRVATFDNDGTLWVEQPIPPRGPDPPEEHAMPRHDARHLIRLVVESRIAPVLDHQPRDRRPC